MKYAIGEVPIGCVIVYQDKIIGRGYNRRTIDNNTLAHAELIAIKKASKKMNDWRLEDIDWNKIPVGWHPANEEEAVARIEAIEAEYERTGKATDFDDFIAELKSEGLWLI